MPAAKRVKSTTLAARQPQFNAIHEVENALILEPETPSPQIAARLAEEAPLEFKTSLACDHFLRLIFSIRRGQERAKHEQYQLPGLGHLPLEIIGDRGKRVPLLEATYAGVREYVKHLNVRRPDTAKQREAKAVLEMMEKARRKDRAITVRRALELYGLPEAEKKEKKPKEG